MNAQTQKLALQFSMVLHSWLTDREMRLVVKRNEKESSPNVCHSHDFCDANMAMDEAYTKVVGRSALDDSPELWNEAWSLAKQKKFNVKALIP